MSANFMLNRDLGTCGPIQTSCRTLLEDGGASMPYCLSSERPGRF